MTNLRTKKELAAKALKVGKNRIVFNAEGLSEIKEAITKQDIKDLKNEGIITIRPVKGRKKVERRKSRRGPGKIKKKVKHRKQEYVKITRKLRKYLMGLRDKGKIDRELYWDLRKKIRMRDFKSKANFRDYLSGLDGFSFEDVKKSKIMGGEKGKSTTPKSNTEQNELLSPIKSNKSPTHQSPTTQQGLYDDVKTDNFKQDKGSESGREKEQKIKDKNKEGRK